MEKPGRIGTNRQLVKDMKFSQAGAAKRNTRTVWVIAEQIRSERQSLSKKGGAYRLRDWTA